MKYSTTFNVLQFLTSSLLLFVGVIPVQDLSHILGAEFHRSEYLVSYNLPLVCTSMDTPRRSYWHTLVKFYFHCLRITNSNRWLRAPRSALLNVSNSQSASIRGSSSLDQHKTPTRGCQRVLSASAKRINLSIRRELSKSHGNLSNLRPKSPPIRNPPTGLHGLHLSPGNYVDDTQKCFSPSYNRQSRQALPNDWMTSTFVSQPFAVTEGSASARKQRCHSPLYGVHDSHYTEVEPAKISIQGLASGYIQPLDFCVPVTRSHPGDENQRRKTLHGDAGRNLTIEHLDMSTAWNGLSDVDANELFRVHRAFVSTLEEMLANELWQIYQQYQQQDSAGVIRPIHTLFSAGIVRGISFCGDQLFNEMAKVLYSSKESMAKAQSGFLRLYLIATDALVKHHGDGSRDTSITVRVRCDPSSPRSHPVVDALWVPDSLVFEGFNEFPVEGQSFAIVPRYYSKSPFRSTHFPKNVRYSIESESRHFPLSWLVWDDKIAGFKGIVPFYSEVDSYGRRIANTCRDPSESIFSSLKIIVQAMLVDDNGSSLRFERILRARLTIKVVPWYANGSETKERSSVPKTYQEIDLPRRAQTQAYLVAKCAELTRELEYVKAQVMMSDRFSEHHNRTLHVSDPQENPNDAYGAHYHHAKLNGPTGGFSIPCSPHDASERLTTPLSPFLHERDPTSRPGSIAKFSVLPPPAIGLNALESQTSNDENVLDATCIGWDPTTRPSTTSQFAAPEGSSTAQHTHSTQELGDFLRLPEQSISLKDTGTVLSSPRQNFEALSVSPLATGEPATISISGKRAREPRARPSLNELLPFNHFKETGKQPEQEIGALAAESGKNTIPLLDSEDEESSTHTWPSGFFYNYFDPLRNIRSSTTLVGEDAPALRASEREGSTNSVENIKHRNQDSGCYMDTGNTDSDEKGNNMSPSLSGLDDGVTAVAGVHSNSFSPQWKGQVPLRQSPSASSSHRHVSTSSTSGSHSTSSDIEFIVEQTPCARKVSRGEQAKLWSTLSQSDSDKENQPGPEGKEVRLSEDEKKAMEEAMRRSLDDLAEEFDDIFLEDSSESNSSYDL